MKKNYFMLVCLMLFMAMQATAQVSSIVDLFGKYKFTATVEFTAEGEAYKSQLPSECDAEISEDGTYIAKIVGFAGSQTQQNINAISIEQSKLKVLNLNNPALWSNGLILANENGDNPYGVWDSAEGAWAVESYGPVYYTFDPATKEISIPDFTVVKMSDYTAAKGTIIAKYTNVKMTLVEATTVEIADISGDWNFKAGSSTYSTMAGSTIPTEFAVALAKTDDTGRAYNATFAIEGFDAVTLPATFDGNTLAIAYDSTYLDAANGIRFGNMNGSKVKQGSIEFKSQSEEAFSLYSGFSFVVDSIGKNKAGDADSTYVKLQQWYMDGTLKLPSEAPAFDWAGVYNVKAGDLFVQNAAGIEWPTEFQFEVTYYETSNIYCVTRVFGYDISGINYGGLMFTPAEDGKSADINTGNLASLGGGMFMKILDMNLTTSPIKLTVNEDGTMSVMGLSVATGEYGSNDNVLNAYYSNLVITKEAAEEEAPAFDWAGEFALASNVVSHDGNTYPASFYVTVEFYEATEYTDAMYCVTNFMGNDVYGINYGGIKLTVAEDGKSATLANGNVQSLGGGSFLKIFDAEAKANPLTITLNEDGTLSMENFTVVSGAWGDNDNNTLVADYKNVSLVKGGELVVPTFDWAGEFALKSNVVSHDGNTYPESFNVTVEFYEATEYTDAMYCVTNFMGNDVYGINYGGIKLTVAEDGKSATLANGNVQSLGGGSFLKIFDAEAKANPLTITLNEDGTLSMEDFTVVSGAWGNNDNNTLVAEYKNVVLVKGGETGIENIVVENAAVKGIFDMQGRKIDAITAPGLYIVNGKKVLVK